MRPETRGAAALVPVKAMASASPNAAGIPTPGALRESPSPVLENGAWVPVDPTYPQERIAFVLADAAVALCVGQKSLAGLLPAGSPLK